MAGDSGEDEAQSKQKEMKAYIMNTRNHRLKNICVDNANEKYECDFIRRTKAIRVVCIHEHAE